MGYSMNMILCRKIKICARSKRNNRGNPIWRTSKPQIKFHLMLNFPFNQSKVDVPMHSLQNILLENSSSSYLQNNFFNLDGIVTNKWHVCTYFSIEFGKINVYYPICIFFTRWWWPNPCRKFVVCSHFAKKIGVLASSF